METDILYNEAILDVTMHTSQGFRLKRNDSLIGIKKKI